MKKLMLFGVVGVASVLLLTGFRGGWGGGSLLVHPERVKRHFDLRVDDALEDLKATDAQRRQIHGIVDGLFPEAVQLAKGQREVRDEMLAQWNAERPDAVKMNALVDQRIDALRAFAHKAVDAALRAHELLTPEQRAQVGKRFRHGHEMGPMEGEQVGP